jgi:hypothetical protein
MLFDLRSRRRRRVIKTVYFFLAILIGVGLVGFGIGTGSGFGNSISQLFGGGGGTPAGDVRYINALKAAEKKARASPGTPALWAAVGKAAYLVATLPDNYNSSVGFNQNGHVQLAALKNAWTRYLALAPATTDQFFAHEVVAAFGDPPGGIADYPTAESAQEVVVASTPSYQAYDALAYYAYLAHQTATGDQAAAKAIALAPKSQKSTVAQALKGIKNLAAAQVGATAATGATSG